MKKRAKKEERTFECETCHISLPAVDDVMKHLADVHQIDANTESAKRTMLSHVDGRDWFSSVYQWSYRDGSVVLVDTVRCERDDDDLFKVF